MKEYMDVHEAAIVLKISEETVRRYLRKKILRGVRIGWEWRISQEEIERLLREGVPDVGRPKERGE